MQFEFDSRAIAMIGLGLGLLTACGGDDAASSLASDLDTPIAEADAMADATAGPADIQGTPGTAGTPLACQTDAEAGTDWSVMVKLAARASSNDDSNLWLARGDLGLEAGFEAVNKDSGELFSLTQLGKLDDSDYSCKLGCLVSPDLQYIAVVVSQALDGTYELVLGRFNSQLEVQILKFEPWTGIVDFEFAGPNLFYTKKADPTCEFFCQYNFHRVALPDWSSETVVLTYPTAGELEQSTYSGHFSAAPDGTKLIMLNPTIRSVTVNMWQEGFGLYELDYICHFGTKGNCTGTGSEYTDQDPVGISPDGRWAVFFTYSERWQRIRLYDTENPDNAYLNIVADVPDGNYIVGACDPGNLEGWQWERVPVASQPVFTPDSASVVFLTQTSCPLTAGGDKPKKMRTNLRRIAVDTLLRNATVAEADICNITNNPLGDITDNRFITSFDISPDGATLVFTATPTYGQNGSLIDDDSARQRNDRELYRVGLDGTGLVQLTEDLSYQALSAQIVTALPDGVAP